MSGALELPDLPASLDRRPGNAKKSWRDVLKIHPAADIFPMMTEAELIELGEDIKKNGLQHYLVLFSEDRGPPTHLLDGRNRLAAMELVGMPVLDEDGDWLKIHYEVERDIDPFAYVISANIKRRHLTAEDKHRLIASLLKADPTKSNRQIAAIVKADDKTVATDRREMERRSEIPHVSKTVDTKGRRQPVRRTISKSTSKTTAAALADKYISKPEPEPSTIDRQFQTLKELWRAYQHTLGSAWERSNEKARRRFIGWLESGPTDDDRAQP